MFGHNDGKIPYDKEGCVSMAPFLTDKKVVV